MMTHPSIYHDGMYFRATETGTYAVTNIRRTVDHIVIPDTVAGVPVTNIDDHAFEGCAKSLSITFGSNVIDINTVALQLCECAKAFNVSVSNEHFKSEDGVIFSKDGSTIVAYPFQKTDEVFNIPAVTTRIGACAFNSAKHLKRIVAKDKLSHIGPYAFKNCCSLVEFPDISEFERLESGMFFGCSNIHTIVISNHVKHISDYLFANCTSLEAIVGDDSVETMGECAFLNCSSLKDIPACTKNLIEIPEGAFRGCNSLVHINLNNAPVVIKAGAFRDCKSMKSIVGMNDVETLEAGVFMGCESLETMTIPPKVTEISDNLFSQCYAIKDVILHEGVLTIREDSFSNCYSLTKLQGYSPQMVIDSTEFGYGCFSNCRSLLEIPQCRYANNKIEYKTFVGCSSLKHVDVPVGIIALGERAFQECDSLESIYIPASVCYFEEYVFMLSEHLKVMTFEKQARITTWWHHNGDFINDDPEKNALYARSNYVTDNWNIQYEE